MEPSGRSCSQQGASAERAFCSTGLRLLRVEHYGEIPNAAELDPVLAKNPPSFRAVDWTREPVLDSEHDARKRIYLVTPKLFGTKGAARSMRMSSHFPCARAT